ncbi:RdlA protein [Streptomyces sp. WM6378]|nr:RdlA protein [Streptomyces sp. WM6378]
MLAAPAMAVGDHGGTTTVGGNEAVQAYGNSSTYGNMSPQIGLIQGSFNKPCIALPAKANLASIVGVVPVSVLQDVPVLSAPQNQQCTENSTQAKGDEPLSHILDQIPVLSGNSKG